MLTACGWTPFDGFEARGVPVTSIVRGETVLEDGEVIADEGHGIFVARSTGRLAGIS